MKGVRMSKPLPSSPSLEQLKNQAKDLLHDARNNAPEALERLQRSVPRLATLGEPSSASSPLTLSDAQLAVAREYGFASWPRLKAHVGAQSGPQVSTQQQELDEAMIRAAVKQKDIKRVQELLDAGANINGRLAEVGTTALGWAACGDDIATMKYLLQRGAQVDIPANGNSTALLCAAGMGQFAAVKLLLASGADVNAPQPGNFTILHGGAYSGNERIVRVLLAAGAAVNARTTTGSFGQYWFCLPYCGETPLHYAMAYGPQAMIEMLLEAGADPHLTTRHGESPFHWAGRHKRPKTLIRWLQQIQSDIS
jgi:hypothetical protein